MIDITVASEHNLLVLGATPEYLKQIRMIVSSMNIDCIEKKSEKDLIDAVDREGNTYGVVIIKNPKLVETLTSRQVNPIALNSEIPPAELEVKLTNYFIKDAPENLKKLIQN